MSAINFFKSQIVIRQKPHPQNFIGFDQMIQITSGKLPADITGTIRIQGIEIGIQFGIFYLNFT